VSDVTGAVARNRRHALPVERDVAGESNLLGLEVAARIGRCSHERRAIRQFWRTPCKRSGLAKLRGTEVTACCLRAAGMIIAR